MKVLRVLVLALVGIMNFDSLSSCRHLLVVVGGCAHALASRHPSPPTPILFFRPSWRQCGRNMFTSYLPTYSLQHYLNPHTSLISAFFFPTHPLLRCPFFIPHTDTPSSQTQPGRGGSTERGSSAHSDLRPVVQSTSSRLLLRTRRLPARFYILYSTCDCAKTHKMQVYIYPNNQHSLGSGLFPPATQQSVY